MYLAKKIAPEGAISNQKTRLIIDPRYQQMRC
jgi:hypothetical protein